MYFSKIIRKPIFLKKIVLNSLIQIISRLRLNMNPSPACFLPPEVSHR